jgi:hypothetical protein
MNGDPMGGQDPMGDPHAADPIARLDRYERAQVLRSRWTMKPSTWYEHIWVPWSWRHPWTRGHWETQPIEHTP